MRPVLRRIAVHGSLTAVVLGVVGLVFAELGSVWLSASPGTRQATGGAVDAPDADGTLREQLRRRVPVFMAVWGFVFVAAGEGLRHVLVGRKPAVPPPAPQPDDAEKLLLELLAQAESKQAEAGGGGQGTGDRGQETGDRKQETPPTST